MEIDDEEEFKRLCDPRTLDDYRLTVTGRFVIEPGSMAEQTQRMGVSMHRHLAELKQKLFESLDRPQPILLNPRK